MALALERIGRQRHTVGTHAAVQPGPVDRHAREPQAARGFEHRLGSGARIAGMAHRHAGAAHALDAEREAGQRCE
jgi:hypothetical protein